MPSDGQPASRQSNRYGRTNSKHRRIRIDNSHQNRNISQKQPSVGFARTPKSGEQARLNQQIPQNQGLAIGLQRQEAVGEQQIGRKQSTGQQLSSQEIAKKLKASGAVNDPKSRDKYHHQQNSSGVDSGTVSRYSTLQQKNISAAEKNIFGPMVDHLEAQNPNLKGILAPPTKVDSADASQGRLRENMNSSMLSNTSRRPLAAAENKRQQRNDTKKLQSQQNDERSSNQLNQLKAKPTLASSQPPMASYYIEQYRDAASCPKFSKLPVQNNHCVTEEASRVNSNERHKFSIQLGCTSLAITESNHDSASQVLEANLTKKDAVVKAERRHIDLENGTDTDWQENQFRTPFNKNLSSKLKQISNPHDQVQSSSQQFKLPFQPTKQAKNSAIPDHPDHKSGVFESKSALEGNASQQLSRAATLKQNITSNSDQKASPIQFIGNAKENSADAPLNHTSSRDKLQLTSVSQNQQQANSKHAHQYLKDFQLRQESLPYFLSGGQVVQQSANIKILSQDNSGDPNDQIMNLYQELARNNKITNDQLKNKGNIVIEHKPQRELQPTGSQSPYPQNIFQNANLATMCSGQSRTSNQMLLSKMRNQNSRIQRHHQNNRQVMQQSQILKGQRSSYQRGAETETKSSKSALPKRQNNSVVARRQESNNVKAPPIFEQNAANALQHQRLTQTEKESKQSKKETPTESRLQIDAYKSANSKTLLPGSLNEQILGSTGYFSKGRSGNNQMTDLTKTMPKQQNQRLPTKQTNSVPTNNNLNLLNQQINQMVNSETFKKIFRDMDEKSKDMTQESRKKYDLHNVIDLDAVLNQLSNTGSAFFANERTEFSGCQSMNSEKSLKTHDNVDQLGDGVNSLDYAQTSTNHRLMPFKKSASNFMQEGKQRQSGQTGTGSLNINIDTMCALTGLTNGDLIDLIENDFQAEKKIADRIIAKSNLAISKANSGGGGIAGIGQRDQQSQQQQTKSSRDHSSLTRNIDILNVAAGMVTNYNVQKESHVREQRDEYSNSHAKPKGSHFLQGTVFQHSKQRQRNSDLCNSQTSLLGSKPVGSQQNNALIRESTTAAKGAEEHSNKPSNLSATDENARSVRRSVHKTQLGIVKQNTNDQPAPTKAFALKHNNQQQSASGLRFFSNQKDTHHFHPIDDSVPISLTPAPLTNIDAASGQKLDYSSPVRLRPSDGGQQLLKQSTGDVHNQQIPLHYSPSNKGANTLKGQSTTSAQPALSGATSQAQKILRKNGLSRDTTATVAVMGSGAGRSSIVLSNRQVMLDKMGRQHPLAVGASDLGINYTGVSGQPAARGGTFQIMGGKSVAPPPFVGKEYGDDGTILLTGSHGKLVAYHGQSGMRNGGTYGPFSGHYGQSGNTQLNVATDTIWARQVQSGERVTSPYSRSNRVKMMGGLSAGERSYSKEKMQSYHHNIHRNINMYDAHLSNRTPVKQSVAHGLGQQSVHGSVGRSNGRSIKCQFNSANSTLNKQQNSVHQPPTNTSGKYQSQSIGGRPNRNQQQQKTQQQVQPEKQPDEFDIEYAKLIARQFPIHDAQGNVIDYSNINEYQLELLALHEEYGEESDFEARRRIFEKLQSMNEEEFYKNRAKNKGASQNSSSTSASTANESVTKKANRRPYGINVGKDGGNPEYKKTVIQLERERLEREKQELIMKRKRNSNYIQQCIRHGNEHYDQQRLNSLAWLRKETKRDEDHDNDPRQPSSHIDDKNLEILRRKQEIIKKYNKMSKENGQLQPDDGLYRYSLIKGNNSNLVKRVLDTREHLMELDQPHLTLYSFKWAPLSRYINYEQLGLHGQKKVVNHLECHGLLTMKDQLYINMHRYCEQNKLNVFQFLPVQFILDISSKSFISEVDRFCQYFNIIEKIRIKSQNKQANGSSAQGDALTTEDYNQQLQKINETIIQNRNIQSELKYKNFVSRKFTMQNEMYKGKNVWLIKPNDFNRGRGVRLFNSLEQLRKLMKEFSLGNEMDFYMHNACCQILANERQLGNIQSLQARQEDSEKNNEQQLQSPKQVQSNGNNSAGAERQITQPSSTVETVATSTAANQIDYMGQQSKQSGAAVATANQPPGAAAGPNFSANVKSEVFVIQKYIERPLLIDGRKFDIRLWVLINCCDLQNQKCYLFREGYIRTSSYTFSLNQEHIDQPFVHLTNNAVQQHDSNYGKLEEGNQLSFTQGQELLMSQKGIDVDFHKIYNNEILDIILMSLKSVDNGRLNPNFKRHSFEIMGYDFMIDEELRPWLIEVNTNPCLEETSALLRQLLPRMIDDAFKLTLDVYLPPKQTSNQEKAPAAPTDSQDKSSLQKPSKQEPSPQLENSNTKSQRSPQKGGTTKQHFKVDGYDDNENLWRHIYTLKNP